MYFFPLLLYPFCILCFYIIKLNSLFQIDRRLVDWVKLKKKLKKNRNALLPRPLTSNVSLYKLFLYDSRNLIKM